MLPTCEWSQPCRVHSEPPFHLPNSVVHAAEEVLKLSEAKLLAMFRDPRMGDLGAAIGITLVYSPFAGTCAKIRDRSSVYGARELLPTLFLDP